MEQDRELIIRLLQEDMMAYRYFIPYIRSMSEKDLENFLDGNKDYQFGVSRKNLFLSLLAKLENYKFIFFWGHDSNYYPYLKELWKNYICIEDLKQIKNDEIKLTKFLETNNIHYSSWPNYVKDDFKKCMEQTENTIIFTCKKMYQSLKGATKYILGKFKDFINYLDKMGLIDLKGLVEKVHIDIIQKVLLKGTPLGYSTYRLIKSQIITAETESICSTSTIEMIKNNTKELIMSNKFILVESLITVANLVFAIKNWYDIKQIANKVDEYKKNLKDIYENFDRHIKEIDYDKRIKSTEDLIEVFNKILKNVENDLKDLEYLIQKINTSIQECESKKISSGLGIAGSAVLTLGGIGCAIMTGGASVPATLIHIGNAAGNAVAGGIHIKNLVECSKVAKELENILNLTYKKKNEIKGVINDLNDTISKLSKDVYNVQIPKYLSFI